MKMDVMGEEELEGSEILWAWVVHGETRVRHLVGAGFSGWVHEKQTTEVFQ